MIFLRKQKECFGSSVPQKAVFLCFVLLKKEQIFTSRALLTNRLLLRFSSSLDILVDVKKSASLSCPVFPPPAHQHLLNSVSIQSQSSVSSVQRAPKSDKVLY